MTSMTNYAPLARGRTIRSRSAAGDESAASAPSWRNRGTTNSYTRTKTCLSNRNPTNSRRSSSGVRHMRLAPSMGTPLTKRDPLQPLANPGITTGATLIHSAVAAEFLGSTYQTPTGFRQLCHYRVKCRVRRLAAGARPELLGRHRLDHLAG